MVVTSWPSAATVVAAHTIETLARDVPLVVRATVGRSEATFNDRYRRIETFTEIQIAEVLKGPSKPGQTILVRELGGAIGDRHMTFAGAAEYREGDEVVLFLNPTIDGSRAYTTWGMAAGKVTLALDGRGQKRAMRDLRGLSILSAGERQRALTVVGEQQDLGDASAFLSRVRRAANGSRR